MSSNHPVIPGHAAGMSPEPMTTARCGVALRSQAWVPESTLVVMGSGLAAALRPAMTAAGLQDLLP
jgi:hypothetical protein